MAINRQIVAGLLIAACLLAVPFAAPYLGGNYVVTLATRVVIFAIAASSLDLLIGRGALVSFGHAAYFGLGGYVVGICAFHLANDVPIFGWAGSNEALVVWPLAMLVSGFAALVIGALSLRTSGVYFIMITLAFAQMIYFVFVALKYYGGDDGLAMTSRNLFAGTRITNAQTFYWISLCALALCLLIQWRLVVSRFGMALRGAASNERRMAALGFSVYGYRLVAFVIAGMMAGLAGALWANLNRFVSPDMLGWVRSGEFMVMVIMGGVSSLLGPVIGAAAFLLVETALAGWTEHWQIAFGPFVLLVALFAPRGIWGLLRGRAGP
jgi:branched-chain amino acid transport system permease protein